MAAMGRRRKTDDGLVPRVYFNNGAYFYVHKSPARWERLGTDKEVANAKGRLYNDPNNLHGTLVYWLDIFLADCEQRVKAGTLAQRTLDDYRDAIEVKPRRDGEPSKSGALRTYFAPPTIKQRGQLAKAMAQAYEHRPAHGETRIKLVCARCRGTIWATVQSNGLSRGQCSSSCGISWTQ